MDRLSFIKDLAALMAVPFLAMAPVIATGAEPDPEPPNPYQEGLRLQGLRCAELTGELIGDRQLRLIVNEPWNYRARIVNQQPT